ncbi:hypothetical protein M0R45_033333 [Rubus argutus]|uniref:Uncharacterized protein n=1 Tax=Rubus argutus TaxID=59490 RepID=A0AAW1WNP9_RUBAR
MDDGTPDNSRRWLKKDKVVYALMALLIGLMQSTGMGILITLLVVALLFYFGLESAAKILQADPDLRDIGAFINKISMLFGIVALIFEVLIIVLAHGSVPVFLWSICMVSVAVAVVVLVRLAFVELKEKLREYWKRVYDGITVAAQSSLELISVMGSNAVTTLRGAFDQLKELFRSQSQNQNQIINELPV